MKIIPLADFCKLTSQKEAGLVLGCSQGGVSQALRANREIYIVEADSDLTYFEIKCPPNSSITPSQLLSQLVTE